MSPAPRSSQATPRLARGLAFAALLVVGGCGTRDIAMSPRLAAPAPASGGRWIVDGTIAIANDSTRTTTDTLSLAKYLEEVPADSIKGVTTLIHAEEGGSLNLGTAYLEIPPRALTTDTEITLGMTSGSFVEYALEPTGLTFRVPVHFTVKYDRTTVDPQDGAELVIAWFDPSRSVWTSIGGETDGTTQKVSVDLSHFSYYALAKKVHSQRGEDAARPDQR